MRIYVYHFIIISEWFTSEEGWDRKVWRKGKWSSGGREGSNGWGRSGVGGGEERVRRKGRGRTGNNRRGVQN